MHFWPDMPCPWATTDRMEQYVLCVYVRMLDLIKIGHKNDW